jgi:hypothetical protein
MKRRSFLKSASVAGVEVGRNTQSPSVLRQGIRSVFPRKHSAQRLQAEIHLQDPDYRGPEGEVSRD